MMNMVLAFTKRLFGFSACHVIVFGSASAILMIVFSEFGQPLVAAVAVEVSWWIGWALDGVVDSHQAARHEDMSQQEWLQRAAVLENLLNGLDGFGS